MSTYLIVFPTIERLSLANAEPVQTKVQSISINNGVSRYLVFQIGKEGFNGSGSQTYQSQPQQQLTRRNANHSPGAFLFLSRIFQGTGRGIGKPEGTRRRDGAEFP
jgi:hypothetical protein